MMRTTEYQGHQGHQGPSAAPVAIAHDPRRQTHRRCFSGSPLCSGCDPCEACAAEIWAHVMPYPQARAGLNGALLGLVHLFVGIAQRQGMNAEDIATRGIGVSLSTVFDGPEAQALAYEEGYVAGWQQFQASMMQNPELAARIQWVPAVVQAPAPAPEPAPAQPGAPIVMGSVMGPGFVPAAERSKPVVASQAPKAKNMTKPMEAEEIAALAGSPVDVPSPPPSEHDARNGTSS